MVHVLFHGVIPDESVAAEPEVAWWWACNDPTKWWRAFADELLEAWVAERPGTRPWGWWRLEAPEPRQVLAGVEFLLPGVGEWAWRGRDGLPVCRPGAGPITVESEASYLRRLKLLLDDEETALTEAAFAPEEYDGAALARLT
jgi:hypothetical protein